MFCKVFEILHELGSDFIFCNNWFLSLWLQLDRRDAFHKDKKFNNRQEGLLVKRVTA